MNVVITSLESMYSYSNMSLTARNLWKYLLCPCILYGLNKNIAIIIPVALLNAYWRTRARQTNRCDGGTFFHAG